MSSVFVSTEKKLLHFEWIFAQLKQSYWGSNLDPMRLADAIAHSECFGLYMADGTGRFQIGFARVVTDWSTFSSLMDVIIDPKYRGKGYGTILMKEVLGSEAVAPTRNVISSREAVEFYQKFGYKVLDDKVLTLNPCR
jgi:ribosomal protein S18 acetylase RimI-like enzyme